jgi:hypothetical protein
MHVPSSKQRRPPLLSSAAAPPVALSTAPSAAPLAAASVIGTLATSILRHPVSSAFLAISLLCGVRLISLFVLEWKYFQIESLRAIDLHLEKVESHFQEMLNYQKDKEGKCLFAPHLKTTDKSDKLLPQTLEQVRISLDMLNGTEFFGEKDVFRNTEVEKTGNTEVVFTNTKAFGERQEHIFVQLCEAKSTLENYIKLEQEKAKGEGLPIQIPIKEGEKAKARVEEFFNTFFSIRTTVKKELRKREWHHQLAIRGGVGCLLAAAAVYIGAPRIGLFKSWLWLR